MSVSSHVLIQEVKCPGHCLPFALDAAQAVARGGHQVTLVLNDRLRDRGSGLIAERVELQDVEIHWVEAGDPPYVSLDTALLEVDILRRLVNEVHPDRTLLPTADAIVRRLPLRRRSVRALDALNTEIDLVCHAVTPATPGLRLTKPHAMAFARYALTRLSRHRLLTPDPLAVFGPGRKWLGRKTTKSLGLLPHPVHQTISLSKAEARTRLNLPQADRLLVVPGVIDPRKWIEKLLSSVAALDGIIDGIVLAGPLAPELYAAVEEAKRQSNHGPKLHVIDRFLSANEFACAIFAADVVWAAYPRWRGIASIQLIAAGQGRTSLVSGAHPSGCFCARQGTGSVIIEKSIPDAVAQALAADGSLPVSKSFISALTSPRINQLVLADRLQIKTLEDLIQADQLFEAG